MSERTRVFPPGSIRRRALRLGILSGVLWSVGTGLTGGEIIRYQALD
jgi:hypothetical protein